MPKKSYIGYIGVANSALTSPAWAEGVTADAGDDYGDDVSGRSVIWRFQGPGPNPDPIPPEPWFIEMEDSGDDPAFYVLQENYDKIRIEGH